MPADSNSLPPVTAAWLTDVLRAHGVLPAGAVRAVQETANAAFNSAALHLAVDYSPDAPADAPRRLFLKRNIDADWAIRGGAREVAFYQFVAPFAAQLPMLVPCYAAEYDAASGRSFCLLGDVSATHDAPVTRDQLIALDGVPRPADRDAVADALARLHGFWWEHPALAAGPIALYDDYDTKANFDRYCASREAEWHAFLGAVGDTVPAAWRAAYSAALHHLPAAWDRYLAQRMKAPRHLTLSHGDCYFSQFLCPCPPAAGPTYLVDFQSAYVNFGALDLANLLTPFWTPAQRRTQGLEEAFLRRYYAGLQAAGVTGYRWDDLWTDYRLMVIIFMHVAVWDQTNGSRQSYWWPKMDCSVAAFTDLDCLALLT